jgi:hypothetical protein
MSIKVQNLHEIVEDLGEEVSLVFSVKNNKVINKAKTACLNSKQNISDHFVDVNKTIPTPKGASKESIFS